MTERAGNGRRGRHRSRNTNSTYFASVLIWMCALSMPAVQTLLLPEIQVLVGSYVGTIGLALIVTWRINDNHRP